MSWYILALKKYAIFNGRSRRMEYWSFNLVNLLILIVLGAVDYMTGTLRLSPIFGLAVLGQLLFLIFMLLEGKRARNQYGPDPKGIGVDI